MKLKEDFTIFSLILLVGIGGGISSAFADTLEWDQDLYIVDHGGILYLYLDPDHKSIDSIDATVTLDGTAYPPVTLTRDEGSNRFGSQFIEFSQTGTVEARTTTENGDSITTSTVEDGDYVDLKSECGTNPNCTQYKINKNPFFVNSSICASPDDDTDGDGLCDSWETNVGLNITDNVDTYFIGCTDGISYDTDPLGVDVCPEVGKPDLYFEIDWMKGHEPSDIALKQIVDAFVGSNYDTMGAEGINIHIFKDEGDLLHVEQLPSPGSKRDPGTDAFKAIHFGFKEISYSNIDETSWSEAEKDLKNYAFHYVIFGHDRKGYVGSSGYAEFPGNDIFITLGSWEGSVGSPDTQAGTLLHEIGHNMGLDHGGQMDSTNCEPNYISVMSFSRQTSDLVGRDVDLSRDLLDDLNEGSGIQTIGNYEGNAVEVVYSDTSGNPYVIASDQPTDFGANMNYFPDYGCDGANEGPLKSNWDYQNLEFTSHDHANWKDGLAVGIISETSNEFEEESTITRVQYESSELVENVPPSLIPIDVCVNRNEKYKDQKMGIEISPNPIFDRICIGNELNIEHVQDMRNSRTDVIEKEVLRTPNEDFIGGDATSAQKQILSKLDDIRKQIGSRNMISAIEESKTLQSWFDGVGKDELLLQDSQSREKIHRLTSKMIDSQLKTVPEFETMAVVILSISIISVIILTRGSTLSLTRVNI